MSKSKGNSNKSIFIILVVILTILIIILIGNSKPKKITCIRYETYRDLSGCAGHIVLPSIPPDPCVKISRECVEWASE